MSTSNEQAVAVVPGAIQKSPTPWLTAAPGLIHSLGVCTALASTPQVACINLTRPGLQSKDLSTNLVHIADQGQNAFMDAYTDLLDISNSTRAMTRDNGYFDRLEEAIGKPEGERAAKRAMDRITETITQVQDAQEEYRRMLRLHAEREATLNKYTERKPVTCATLGVTAGMFGAILGATGSAAMLAFSGDRTSTLEAELQKKVTLGHQLEMEMQKVRNGLAGLNDDKMQLEKMTKVIIVVSRILQGLCNDIVELVRLFAHLNATIRQLIADYKGAKDMEASIREDVEKAEDEGVEARISRHEMRRQTVMIHNGGYKH